jgi:hypothetical protein
MSRAAALALGASLGALGCSGGTLDTSDAGTDAAISESLYGGPPVDDRRPDAQVDGGQDAGVDAANEGGDDAGADTGNIQPPYGLPPTDAGSD